MPAQKRSFENSTEDLPHNIGGANQDQLQPDKEGSDRSPANESAAEEEDKFIMVKLSEVRKEVQCPICLGIIRKTRTVMECLHRFCRDCIDKSMRMGNKECPACRKHCASRRSLRDDPNYDQLIAALYPDIDQYEDEELAFHEEESTRNKQIQASIMQTVRRQSEALSKKRKRSRSTAQRRLSNRSDNDDAPNNTSSPDECPETRVKRARRFRGLPSPVTENEEGGNVENDAESNKDMGILSAGLVGTSDMLVWGKGGIRSHTRHGSAGGGGGKYARTNRLARLADHLRNLDENNELDIHIVFVSLEGEKAPTLPQAHLCCRPAFSVRNLCEFIAGQTSLKADEVEILAVKELHSKLSSLSSLDVELPNTSIIEACKDELQVLDFEQTLGVVKAAYNFTQGHMILAYRQKSPAGERLEPS